MLKKKSNLTFLFPNGDDTVYGTTAAIREGTFKLNKINFQPNDIVLDLGCNIGVLSCLIASQFNFVSVYGFDASPLAIKYARANAIKNELLNVLFFNKAIGGSNLDNQIFSSDSTNITTLIDKKMDSENRTDDYICDKIAISEIFDSKIFNFKKIKFLKVDIEGGEFEVFDYIFNQRPDILDRIEYIHAEIHKCPKFDWEGLEKKLREVFGPRLLS